MYLSGKKPVFWHVRIELSAHGVVVRVGRPAHECVDRALGAVAVVNLEGVAHGANVRLHLREGFGCFPRQYDLRRLVTGNRSTDEVVRAGVTNLREDGGV